MQNENSLPPSVQKPFDDLMQNTTPQSKSSAAISQEMLSQTVLMQFRKISYHSHPTPSPADCGKFGPDCRGEVSLLLLIVCCSFDLWGQGCVTSFG